MFKPGNEKQITGKYTLLVVERYLTDCFFVRIPAQFLLAGHCKTFIIPHK